MASGRHLRFSLPLAIGLIALAVFPCLLTVAPAFGQADVLGIINAIVQRQQELAERRRQEVAAFRRMQYGLSQLGYYDGPIDGDFGPHTAQALAAYRRSIGRPISEPLSIEEVAEIETRASEQIATGPPPMPTEPVQNAATSSSLLRADIPPKIGAKLTDDAAWIVIASRPTPEEAKLVAGQYVQEFPSTTVIRSMNGSFAVTIGWLNKEHGRPLKDSLVSRRLIPRDSFLSNGEKFKPPIWSVDGRKIQSRLDLLRYSLLRTAPTNAMIAGFQEQVTGLSDDYLSLKSDPSTSSKELRQLPEGTLLKIHRSNGGWQQVEMLNGMTGWVSLGREVVVPPEPISQAEQVRRDRIKRDANTFLDNLSVYLSAHPETLDIASVAQEVSELKSAMEKDDFTAIEATNQKLKRQMEAVSGWSDFVRKRAEESRQAEIQALGEAVSLALKHQEFLRDQIAKNLTSPNTAALATLLKNYESALRSPVLSTVTDLNDRLKKIVSDDGLTDAYDTWMAGPGPPHPAEKPPEIVKTDKNRFLLEGALTDWVLVFNAGGKAPHVARNIRGDIVFEGQRADVCILHPAAGKIEVAQVEDILSGYKVDTVRLDLSPCPETNLQSQDVLIASRGELLKQSASYLAPLLGLVENDTFQELGTLTSEEFEKIAKALDVKAIEIENKIKMGIEGNGLIKIENGPAVICMTTADQEAAHRALINDQRKILLRSFNAAPEIQRMTVEAAFIAAKRGKCGAIYARRLDLSDAIQSFQRDKVHFSVVPLWFDPEVVADREKAIQLEKETLVQQERDRAKELELKKQQEQADAERKGAREAELQTQHGPQARARAEEIANSVKLLADDKDTWASVQFPELAGWYRSRTAENWEFVGLDYKVTDYGTADWKGRPLEVVFIDVLISMKNRLLGENQSSCFTLGLIFDAEFQMPREPFGKKCEEAAEPLRAWKQKWGFLSQWVVE